MNPEIWRYVFDAIDDPIFLHDAEYHLLLANRAYFREAGMAEVEAIGKLYWEVFPRGTGPLPGCKRSLDEVLAGSWEEVAVGERLFVSKGQTVRDDQGNVLYALHVLGDITAQNQAEANLRKSEERFRQMSGSLPQLVWTCRADGQCDYLGPQWVAYTGIPEAEQLGYGWLQQAHPDDRERLVAAWEASFKQGVDLNVEFRIRRHDGVYRWFKTRAAPQRDDEGRIVKWLGSNTDIDDLKQAENALAESEERFRRALETARDAIITLDGESGAITAWNAAAEALFGYSKDETIGRDIHEFLPPPRFREAALKGMAHFAKTGEGAAIGKTLELAAMHKSGAEFPVELSLSAMQIRGKWHATGIVRDITERRQAEEKNRRISQMYRTISRCNEELVRAPDEMELNRLMCRVLIEEGGIRMAWVGYAETGADKRIRPMAVAGIEEGFLESLNPTWADEEQEIAGTAVRTGQAVVCHDIRSDTQCVAERELALQRGYLTAAAFPLRFDQHGLGVLVVYGAQANEFTEEVVSLLAELAGDLAFGIRNLRSRADRLGILEKLELSLDHAVTAIAATVEMRDPYTAGHQRRVAKLATAIAAEIGLPDDQMQGLHMACVVHDIGKIHVPAEILSSPSKLTDAEFEILKTHPKVGWEILKGIDFPWPVAEIVYQHHERLDGSGYPHGLKGDEILLEARILTVADVVEAMTSHRPYRPGFGVFPALQEISRNKGKLYDAAAAEACLRVFMEKNYEW